MSNKKGWTPVARPGGIFCSPKCGFDCTRESHDKAQSDAHALAADLGNGWVPGVWENLGWHYEAVKGCATVTAEGVRTDGTRVWVCELRLGIQFISRGATPREALQNALNQSARFAYTIHKAAQELNS